MASYQRELEAKYPGLGWWRPGAESSLKFNYSGAKYPDPGFPSSAYEAGQRVGSGFEQFATLGEGFQVPSVVDPENMWAMNPPGRDELGRGSPQGVLDFLAGMRGEQPQQAGAYSGMEDRTPLPPMLNGGYTGKGYSPGLFAPGPMSSVYDVPELGMAPTPAPVPTEGFTGNIGGVGGGVGTGGGSVVRGGGTAGSPEGLPMYPLIDPSTYPSPPQRQLLDTDVEKYYATEREMMDKYRPQEPEEAGLGGMILQALAGGAIGFAAGGSPQAGLAGALGAVALGQREEANDKERYQNRLDSFNKDIIGLEREKGREKRQIVRDNASIGFSNQADLFKHQTGIVDTNVTRQYANEKMRFEYAQKQLDRAREDAARARTNRDMRIQILDDGTAVAVTMDKTTGQFSVQPFVFSQAMKDEAEREKMLDALGGVTLDSADAKTFNQLAPELRPAAIRAKLDFDMNTPRARVILDDERVQVLLREGQITPEEAGIDPVTGAVDPAKRNENAISVALGVMSNNKPGFVESEAQKSARNKLGMHYYLREQGRGNP